MMKNGADDPSFSTIVGFGENSSQPHYSPGERKLKKGDAPVAITRISYEIS